MSEQELIKFPTITKLLYTGDPNITLRYTMEYHPHKTSTSLNKVIGNKASQNTAYGSMKNHRNVINNLNRKFNLVELPTGTDVMAISAMNMTKRQFVPPKKNYNTLIAKKSQNQSERKPSLNPDINKDSKKVISLLKNRSKSNQSITGINFSLGRSLGRSHSNFTIQKKIDTSQLYSQIISMLALVNGIYVSKDNNRIRRAKIQQGNNGLLIKHAVKKRGWWNTTSEDYQQNIVSLIWTEHSIKKKSKASQNKSYINIQEDDYPIKTNSPPKSNSPQKKQSSPDKKGKDKKQMKYFFQRNFGQCLLFYPKMLQLFFLQDQQKPKNISKWISNLNKPKRCVLQENLSIENHLPKNSQITNKKMLYKNLMEFYQAEKLNPDNYIPKTYHLTAFDWQQVLKTIRDQQSTKKKHQKNKQKEKQKNNKAWFIKPGEDSNRGRGISVYKTIEQVIDYILKYPPKNQNKSLIIQKYITPMLYEERKFDIRCFMLGVKIYDHINFYWYQQGYARTASQKFTLNNTSKNIHLTNDAVQKYGENYGEFEKGNKLSYSELQKYLKISENIEFSLNVLPQMKKIATHICKAAYKIGSETQSISFQLFGLDYILNDKGVPFLLEVNTNPSLEICCNLLSRIINQVVQNTFRLVLDVLYPCSKGTPQWNYNFITQNKFALIHRRLIEQNPLEQEAQ